MFTEKKVKFHGIWWNCHYHGIYKTVQKSIHTLSSDDNRTNNRWRRKVAIKKTKKNANGFMQKTMETMEIQNTIYRKDSMYFCGSRKNSDCKKNGAVAALWQSLKSIQFPKFWVIYIYPMHKRKGHKLKEKYT